MKEGDAAPQPQGRAPSELHGRAGAAAGPRRKTHGAIVSASRRSPAAASHEVDLGPLENYIGFHLRLAQELALRAFAKRAGKSDFRPGWFAILMIVRLNPGLSQSALARAIGRDKSTISPLIRELEGRALIIRRPAPGDRRSVTLSLTPAGEKELDSLIVHVEAHDRRLDEVVGEDKSKLIVLLRKIAGSFA
jgi:DNA-binding MarR family transcriptional regulator